MARGETTTVDGEVLFIVELSRNSRQIRPANTLEFWHVTTVPLF